MADFRGIIGPVLSALRVERNGVTLHDIKVDPGGGALVDVEHTDTPGADCPPLAGVDFLAGHSVVGTGRFVASGYIDTVNPSTSNPGQRRTRGRDMDGVIREEALMSGQGVYVLATVDPDGVTPTTIWQALFTGETRFENEVAAIGGKLRIHANGKIEASNTKGSVTIETDGTVKVTSDGAIEFATDFGDSIKMKSDGGIDLVGAVKVTGPFDVIGATDFTGNFSQVGDAVLGSTGQVDLGGTGGPGVARIGDQVDTGPDTIQTGSGTVFAVD